MVRYTFASGDLYEGNIENRKKEGKGKYTYANGDVYEGEFGNNRMEGEGKFTFADGSIYQGQWKNGKKEGNGKYVYWNKDCHEGEWKNGVCEGKGKFTFADGSIYEGDFRNDKRDGEGKFTFPGGDVYEGGWKNGNMEGVGKYTLENKNCHEGGYKNDMKEGKGTVTYANGDSYEGEWSNGKKVCRVNRSREVNSVAAQVALDPNKRAKNMIRLIDVVLKHKTMMHGRALEESVLRDLITEELRNMELSLGEKVQSSLNSMISIRGPSLSEKMDDLLDMMGEILNQSRKLEAEFALFRSISEDQSRLLATIEAVNNRMPRTFIIIPGADVDRMLPSSSSTVGKVKSFSKRSLLCGSRLALDERRIVFICPVTLERVKCGPDGKGYKFNIATDALRRLAPALKWGLLALKIILATQGLESVAPHVDFPLNIDSDEIESMITEVLGDITPSALVNDAISPEETVRKDDLRDSAFNVIYEHIRKVENGKGPNWVPLKTGLNRTKAPIGKGPSMWVSPKGSKKFTELGEESIIRPKA